MTGTSGSRDDAGGQTATELIDGRIAELGDWRGELLAQVRALIQQAHPDVVEEWKWRGVPVWSHAGTICTGETYENYVKLTFAHGAALDDPAGLFNASLEGNTRRRRSPPRPRDAPDLTPIMCIMSDRGNGRGARGWAPPVPPPAQWPAERMRS